MADALEAQTQDVAAFVRTMTDLVTEQHRYIAQLTAQLSAMIERSNETATIN